VDAKKIGSIALSGNKIQGISMIDTCDSSLLFRYLYTGRSKRQT